MGRDDGSDDSGEENGSSQLNPALTAWRGLAHDRTHMKRMALKRDRETRTTSDVYLLEDIVSDVRFICDLPMALRLNILWCAASDRFAEFLGYELHGPGHRVAKQCSKAFYFTIVFTGSVKCTYHQLGVQEDKSWIIPAGKWFGDRVLEDWNYRWEYTIGIKNDKVHSTFEDFKDSGTESLTLTRRDYERVLDIKKTPELREWVSFLKGIERFKCVPRQSLLRLANVLSYRTYSKNQIITFQGDDSAEMYFMRSGECRVFLEVPEEKLSTPLPRASSFLKQCWPTQYHRCQMDDRDKQKDWWHPSFEKPRHSTSKPGDTATSRSSRCQSVYSDRLPKGLGSATLRNSDAVVDLVKRGKPSKRKSIPASVKRRQGEITPITNPSTRGSQKTTHFRRHSSGSDIDVRRSSTAGGGTKEMKRRATALARIPIGAVGGIRTSMMPEEERPSEWGSRRGSVEAMARSGTLNLEDKVTPPFPTGTNDRPHWPFVGGVPHTSLPATRFSLMQIHFSDMYGGKRAKKYKYSLRLFLHDPHRKVPYPPYECRGRGVYNNPGLLILEKEEGELQICL